MAETDKYLVLLRRELVRAQARLKRAERECERLREENARLKALAKGAGETTARVSPKK
jgi:hypothetical protein